MKSLTESITSSLNESVDKNKISKALTDWVNGKIAKAIKDRRISRPRPFAGSIDTTPLKDIKEVVVKVSDTSVDTRVILTSGTEYHSNFYCSSFSAFDIAQSLGTTLYSGVYGITAQAVYGDKRAESKQQWVKAFEAGFSGLHDTREIVHDDFMYAMSKAGIH